MARQWPLLNCVGSSLLTKVPCCISHESSLLFVTIWSFVFKADVPPYIHLCLEISNKDSHLHCVSPMLGGMPLHRNNYIIAKCVTLIHFCHLYLYWFGISVKFSRATTSEQWHNLGLYFTKKLVPSTTLQHDGMQGYCTSRRPWWRSTPLISST